jgi:septum formation protein
MLYLASQSPRRRELLEQVGVSYKVVKVDVDETRHPEEAPENYVRRIALAKASAGRELYPRQPVLGADTSVVLDNRPLGKPRDRQDGLEMLLALSGRDHMVLTGVSLMHEKSHYRLSESHVQFRRINQDEAAAYWDTGEPADKAGAYAIQGFAALFIRHIRGSYSGIMGLPLYETGEILIEAGLGSVRLGSYE